MKPAGLPIQPGYGEKLKGFVVHSFLCDVNDTRDLMMSLTPSDVTLRPDSRPLG